MRRVEMHVNRLCFAATRGSLQALGRSKFISGERQLLADICPWRQAKVVALPMSQPKT